VSENFASVVDCDFEYEVDKGELPNVLCMVAYVLDEHLQHVRTVRLWRGEFGSRPPFDIGEDTLFAAYSAWAEMTCFKVFGWKFPEHIFDQHTAYLAASNVLMPHAPNEVRMRPRKRLQDARRAYGVDGWERIDKEVIASAKAAGKATVAKPFLRTVRKMFGHQHCCCVVNCWDAPHLRRPTSSAFCTGLITARNALR
jgi:DNA polymerase I